MLRRSMVSASTSAMAMARATLRILRSRVFALVGGELLGVGEAQAGEWGGARREDDGGGYDGAEEGAAAYFVDAGDDAVAVVAEGLLGGVGAD